MQLIKFSASSQVVTVSGSVASDCNGITFINIGTDTCNIFGYDLVQGQQFSIACNVGETDETNYNIQFAGVTTDQRILVIRKNYKNTEF